ncbi:MAG: hypothetical protein LIP00_03565 [Parabacteroides sp.]|nr:hypothetical protein [Parabacteroides sp.]
MQLPAAGYRNNASGAGTNRGANGLYWSCTVDGTRTPRLNFNSSGADMNSDKRANGFSVRCVQVFIVPLRRLLVSNPVVL